MSALLTIDDLERLAREGEGTIREELLAAGVAPAAALRIARDLIEIAEIRCRGGDDPSAASAQGIVSAFLLGVHAGREIAQRGA